MDYSALHGDAIQELLQRKFISRVGTIYLLTYMCTGILAFSVAQDCKSGLPKYIYVIGMVEVGSAVYVDWVLTQKAMKAGSTISLRVLLWKGMFTALGHWSMFNHMANIATVRICDVELTDKYDESMKVAHLSIVPVLNFLPDVQHLVPHIISRCRMWGFMLGLYLVWGFLPQLCFINAMGITFLSLIGWCGTCCAFQACYGASLWALAWWIPAVILIGVFIFVLVIGFVGLEIHAGDITEGRLTDTEHDFNALENVAWRANLSNLKNYAQQSRGVIQNKDDTQYTQQVAQPFARIIYDNLMMLFIQSSILAIGFHNMGMLSFLQIFGSLMLSMFLACSSLYNIACKKAQWGLPGYKSQIGLPMCVACVLIGITLLRIAMIFHCPSHLWNLSTGCVPK